MFTYSHCWHMYQQCWHLYEFICIDTIWIVDICVYKIKHSYILIRFIFYVQLLPVITHGFSFFLLIRTFSDKNLENLSYFFYLLGDFSYAFCYLMVHIHWASDAEARDDTTALVTCKIHACIWSWVIAKRLMINLFSSVIYWW